ncbi:MAG TPA: DUF4369 domain-containing protein [Bacteroidales bacterium]|jgi:peroxiredoxin|nr:redoxin domain-containing protein [Bacteroidales bacterium]HNY57108.1 DUF4369 domain-containing protein [Bacteroidales bacterium]HPA70448.1 DUF4369 domain-containing protein [Bacteroidales bacterium]HPH73738.1 DUF4369 domain-containing protein [Bacteroidales bacterium]HPX53562.1 DUF4369 domain-containing protein [Bacteroidales bacterium]
MKKTIILLLVVAVAAACAREPKFTLTGTIDGAGNETVVLQKRIPGGYQVLDSATIENGTFKIEGVIDYPQMVNLAIRGKRGGLNFFIENSDIAVHGHADSLYMGSVSGSATQAEYDSYKALLDETNAEMTKLYDSYRQARTDGNNELVASLEKEIEALDEKQMNIKKEFLANNTSSFIAPAVLSEISYYLEADEMEGILNSFDTTLNQVQTVITLKERLVQLKAVAIGQKAPDFTLNDPDGNPISLSSKIGGDTKLLLLDFWASWCGPCRAENPFVVKTWTEYNKKGFDVFGVSLDRSREDWLKGIQDDKLTWTHVSEVKYWDCAPAKLYAVSAIPSNFLIDENGIIVGHNLRGDALAEKVKEILDAR